MAWTSGEKGLLLDGATGGGKTRSLVALIEKLEMSQRYGAGISYHSAPVMGDKISALAFQSPHDMDSFLLEIEGAPILAIDDLGAQRPTERVAASLHRIIDTRYAQGLPVLISTNCTPDQLQKQLLDVHGRTIRRLNEMTEVIHFKEQWEQQHNR
jgi:DNA replication protein DnaC